MSFRENLQHLRATRGMTQENLAVLLGVSRQSVTKWEAERAYPEMDKLLKICSVFGCTLDELVQGDLTGRPTEPAASHYAPPEDTCGYDAHMRSFAWRIALGVSTIIAGVALTTLFGEAFGSDTIGAAVLFLGIAVGLVFLIPAAIDHGSFMREHPYIEDFYTSAQRQAAARTLAYGVVSGIVCIIAGVVVGGVFLEDVKGGPSILLLGVAVGVGLIIYGGIAGSRTNVDDYNHEAVTELPEETVAANVPGGLSPEVRAARRRSKLTGAICGCIMIAATIVGLLLLFVPGLFTPFFWLSWAVGGLLCGMTSIVVHASVGN